MTNEDLKKLSSVIRDKDVLNNRLSDAFNALKQMADEEADKRTKKANSPFVRFYTEILKGNTVFKNAFKESLDKEILNMFPMNKNTFIETLEKEWKRSKKSSSEFTEKKINTIRAAQEQVAQRILEVVTTKNEWKKYFRIRQMEKTVAIMKSLSIYNKAHNVSIFLCSPPDMDIVTTRGLCTMEILLSGLQSVEENYAEIEKLGKDVLQTNLECHFYAGVLNRKLPDKFKDLSNYQVIELKVIEGNTLWVRLKLKDFKEPECPDYYYYY